MDRVLKTWASILFFAVFLGAWKDAQAGASSAGPLEKVVISDIIYSSECVGSTSDYTNQSTRSVPLRQQLNARFPREILSARTMALEDLDDYKVIAQWNPQNYNVRQLQMIQGVLDRFNIKHLIRLTISCDPESHRPVTMSASMTGLDEIDRILKCDKSTRGKGKQHRICNANEGVFKAIRYSTVEIDSEKPIAENFGRVLVHLLHVPEVRFGATGKTADPGEMLSLPFLININDGTEKAYNGPAAEPRKYHVEQDVVQIPKDVAQKVCAEPADYWKKLRCVHGDAIENETCDAADDIKFKPLSLIHNIADLSAQKTKGGERIEFRVVGYPTSYLIRAQAVATEYETSVGKDRQIRSLPIYQCIDVRWRERSYSITIGTGVTNDFKTMLNQDNANHPAATMGYGAFQITVGHLWPVNLLSSYHPWFPASKIGGGVGLTYLSGIYPCPTGTLENCGPAGYITRRATAATALEFKFMGEIDLYIWKLFTLRVLGETNLGFDYTRSEPVFPQDGIHFVWGATLGLGAGILRANSDGLFQDITLALQWQLRARIPDTGIATRGHIDAMGVPDRIDIWWLSLRTNFSP